MHPSHSPVKSMTAYGRAKSQTAFGKWVIEIHSLNRKMLDLSVYLPKELLRFDTEVRKWISESLARGQITVRIHSSLEEAYQTSFSVLSSLKHFWEKMAKELGFDPKEAVDLPFIVEQMKLLPDQVSEQQEKEIGKALHEGIHKALQSLMEMKEREGSALKKEIEMRLSLIEAALSKILKYSPEATQRYREKMQEKLKEMLPLTGEWEKRVLQEVALFAEKVDITEELTRLRSHLAQFFDRLKAGEKTLGRTLDFLIQEMHREINTIASKSSDIDISQEVIIVKSELDKIREQVQNIE